MEYISIHHLAPMRGEWAYYKKGKKYTYQEYCKLIRRQQLIKEITLFTVFGVFVLFRAYVFLEYGI